MDGQTTMLEREDLRMLVDIGFIALNAGQSERSVAIFNGIAAIRPEAEAGPLGLALNRMALGQHLEAAEILRRLPPSDAALTYLGLCAARLGDVAEARRILRNVERTAPGTPFAELARASLDELDPQG